MEVSSHLGFWLADRWQGVPPTVTEVAVGILGSCGWFLTCAVVFNTVSWLLQWFEPSLHHPEVSVLELRAGEEDEPNGGLDTV